jgi:hypothetical protein
MPATQPSKELRVFCHEHHVEMKLSQSLSNSEGNAIQTLACTDPHCLVHYNISRGYFTMSQNGNTNQIDMVPEIRCPHDGRPMYLAEIDREKRDFRLWKCPQCDGRRTNEEGLIGLASQGIRDVSGKSWVKP